MNTTDETTHHVVHCVEYLRNSVMCSGDTTLEGKGVPGSGFGVEHQCVDYEALQAWAHKHELVALNSTGIGTRTSRLEN